MYVCMCVCRSGLMTYYPSTDLLLMIYMYNSNDYDNGGAGAGRGRKKGKHVHGDWLYVESIN